MDSTIRLALDSSQGGEAIYSYDLELLPDGRLHFLRADEPLLELWGYTLEEMRAGAWADLILPSDQDRIESIIEVARSGQPWSGRIRTSSRDGGVKVFVVNLETELLGQRKLVRGILRDVTDVTRSNVALHEREARLRLLSNQLSIVMWSTDAALRVTWSSGERPISTSDETPAALGDFFGDPQVALAVDDASRRAVRGQPVTFDHRWGGHDFRFSIERYEDELDDVTGTIGVAVDLTGVPGETDITSAEVRRTSGSAQEDPHPEAITVGDLWIDPEAYLVKKNGREISLTITEFKLLLEFVRRPERVLSQQVLAERVWGYDFISSHSSIPMAIKRLRSKIEDDPAKPRVIETVRGLGYRMRLPHD